MKTNTAPHSTLQRLSQAFLPPSVHRFFFSQSEKTSVAHLAIRALFGAVSGTVIFLAIGHNLPLTFDLKVVTGILFTAMCAAGGALSSSFRCSVLLVFPSMLGSRGRSYLTVLALSLLFSGPVSNIQRNLEAVALSLSCNLDLQVRHSRLLWRDAIRPFILVTQELVEDQLGFEAESRSVNGKFQAIRDEMILQYGYDGFQPDHSGGNSTQEQFVTKTMMQCDGVVEQGIQRCADWFNQRWTECMEAIAVPVINHMLCVSMKFHFLCNVMRVMTPWCRENIPVEGNFGEFFDQLNASVDLLAREFTTEVVVEEEEQQEVLSGDLLDQEFTEAVKSSFQNLTAATEQVLDVLQLLLSFTFITVFIQAFGYLRSYTREISFDNVYITTYFRQIDARRRTAGKRCLLPLRRSEVNQLVFPWSPKIYPKELTQVTSGVFQVLSISLLSFVLLTVDYSLFHILDIINRHTFTQFNLTSSHHVDIRVGGDSMMARLLRKTISAFNSSSSLNITSDNSECAAPPFSLPVEVYVSCVCCVLLMVLFSCIQVYTNRLKRVITAFYLPKREKKRVLFLYNLHINRRISSSETKQTEGRSSGARFQGLTRWGRRLWGRNRREEPVNSSLI